MGPKSKKQHIALPAALAAALLLFLVVGGIYFVRYLERQIYEERTSQLVEITAQVQTNLDNALDTQWRYLTVAVNVLEETIEADSHNSRIILLSSQGSCYDTGGKRGVWSDLDILSSGEDRYTHITYSMITSKIDPTPLPTSAGSVLSAPNLLLLSYVALTAP